VEVDLTARNLQRAAASLRITRPSWWGKTAKQIPLFVFLVSLWFIPPVRAQAVDVIAKDLTGRVLRTGRGEWIAPPRSMPMLRLAYHLVRGASVIHAGNLDLRHVSSFDVKKDQAFLPADNNTGGTLDDMLKATVVRELVMDTSFALSAQRGLQISPPASWSGQRSDGKLIVKTDVAGGSGKDVSLVMRIGTQLFASGGNPPFRKRIQSGELQFFIPEGSRFELSYENYFSALAAKAVHVTVWSEYYR
jgi:hypothetical protein